MLRTLQGWVLALGVSLAGVVAHAPREDFPPTDQMNEEIVLSNWLGVPLAPEQIHTKCPLTLLGIAAL